MTSPTQVSAFKKGMEMHAHFYAAQTKIDVVALRIGSIYGPHYYSMHNPISRICHGAAKQRRARLQRPPRRQDLRGRPGRLDLREGRRARHPAVHTATLAHRVYNIASGRAISNRERRGGAKAVPGRGAPS